MNNITSSLIRQAQNGNTSAIERLRTLQSFGQTGSYGKFNEAAAAKRHAAAEARAARDAAAAAKKAAAAERKILRSMVQNAAAAEKRQREHPNRTSSETPQYDHSSQILEDYYKRMENIEGGVRDKETGRELMYRQPGFPSDGLGRPR